MPPIQPPVEPGAAISRTRVVAVLRAPTNEHVLAVARQLVDTGMDCLELTTTTPDAHRLLRVLVTEFDGAAEIGMGSVRGATAARAALDAGAAFLVSPILDTAVIAQGAHEGVPTYPGALTPTELAAAETAGAAAVKLFPASSVGPSHLRAVREPLPHLRVVPTGGIGVDDTGRWLAAGAFAVGLGGSLIGDALLGGDLAALADRAARAVAAAHGTPR